MRIPSSPVIHNKSKSRFEIEVGGQLAVAEYREQGDRMIFTHTEVPPRFRGHGIAERLVLAGFDAARTKNLRIVALCSYVAHVLREHPEFQELAG
ncbi:MAG TPA: GNAT family N-acetyltransferase [Terrimicrobiaceae bacterium]